MQEAKKKQEKGMGQKVLEGFSTFLYAHVQCTHTVVHASAHALANTQIFRQYPFCWDLLLVTLRFCCDLLISMVTTYRDPDTQLYVYESDKILHNYLTGYAWTHAYKQDMHPLQAVAISAVHQRRPGFYDVTLFLSIVRRALALALVPWCLLLYCRLLNAPQVVLLRCRGNTAVGFADAGLSQCINAAGAEAGAAYPPDPPAETGIFDTCCITCALNQ